MAVFIRVSLRRLPLRRSRVGIIHQADAVAAVGKVHPFVQTISNLAISQLVFQLLGRRTLPYWIS